VKVPFAIEIVQDGDVSVVGLSGELDISTTDQFFDATVDLVDAGRRHVVADLTRLTFCDSSGLGTIVKLRKIVDDAGGELLLARPSVMVAGLLELTGLDRVVRVFPTPEAAVGAVTHAR